MTNADLSFTPAWQLREWIASGQLSPVDLTTHMLRRIEELNPKLNAFLTVCGDEAVAAAKQAEVQALRGEATWARFTASRCPSRTSAAPPANAHNARLPHLQG